MSTHTLSDQLHRLLKPNVDRRRFLPCSQLEKLVTSQSIHGCLPNASKELVAYIVNNARKVFTTLLFAKWNTVDLITTMENFKSYELMDKHLPIEKGTCSYRSPNSPTDPDFGSHIAQTAQCTHHEGWSVTHKWNDTDFECFHEAQSKLLSPVFTKETFTYELKPEYVQPILKSNRHDQGHFSTVHKAMLHQDHQQVLPVV